MGRIHRKGDILIKAYETVERLRKEAALLRFLSATDLAPVVPMLTGVAGESGRPPFLLKMSAISGIQLRAEEFTADVACKLGSIVARIHRIRGFAAYGSLNEALEVAEPHTSFHSFVSGQIRIWRDRLASSTSRYNRLADQLLGRATERAVELGELGPPRFAHNDIDLKNVLVSGNEVVGIIDWEFAGAYPLAWELRKFTYLFWARPACREAFATGYRSVMRGMFLPAASDEALLAAADCLGALGWAHWRADQDAVRSLNIRLKAALARALT